jgi:membrane protease YdiL (CAAX protease family)
MTTLASAPRVRPALRVAWLLAGLFGIAVARAAVNGQSAATAFVAGAAFGAAALALAVVDGWRPAVPSGRSVAVGLTGGLVLVALPVLMRGAAAHGIGMRPEPFVAWVLITVLVATGEEVLVRGALLDAGEAAFGMPAAIGLTSLAFALIHVPLYGWAVVPLDLAAGIWLAGLRLAGGGLGAPIVAHALADLATWWL